MYARTFFFSLHSFHRVRSVCLTNTIKTFFENPANIIAIISRRCFRLLIRPTETRLKTRRRLNNNNNINEKYNNFVILSRALPPYRRRRMELLMDGVYTFRIYLTTKRPVRRKTPNFTICAPNPRLVDLIPSVTTTFIIIFSFQSRYIDSIHFHPLVIILIRRSSSTRVVNTPSKYYNTYTRVYTSEKFITDIYYI